MTNESLKFVIHIIQFSLSVEEVTPFGHYSFFRQQNSKQKREQTK